MVGAAVGKELPEVWAPLFTYAARLFSGTQAATGTLTMRVPVRKKVTTIGPMLPFAHVLQTTNRIKHVNM